MTKKANSKDQKVATQKTTDDNQTKTEAPLISPSTVLKLVIPADQAGEAYKKVLRKASQQVKVEGFRLGNAPTKLVEEKVGREKLVNLALDQLLPKAYADLITKEQKKPLTQPELRIIHTDEGKDWELEILIAEKPLIEVKDWQKLVKKANNLAQQEIKKDEKLNDQQKQEIRLRNIFKELVQHYKPSVPELLVKQDVNRQLDEVLHQLEHLKLSLDEYLQRRQISFEQLSSDMAINAISGWQLEFILDAIITDQKIEPTTQDLEDYLAKYKSTKKYAELDHHIQHQLEYEVQRQQLTQVILKIE